MNSSGDPRKVHSLRELQQDIEPARDLWPAVEKGLAPRRKAWVVPVSLAASLLLCTVLVMVGSRIRDVIDLPLPTMQALQPVQAPQPESMTLVRAELAPEVAYQRDRDQLLAALPARLALLPLESQQSVRDSLAAIQQAMQQLESALGHEASNALLQELLIRTQREEMRLLTTVEEIDGFNPEI